MTVGVRFRIFSRQNMSGEVEKLFDELVMNQPKLEIGLRAMALSGVAAPRSVLLSHSFPLYLTPKLQILVTLPWINWDHT